MKCFEKLDKTYICSSLPSGLDPLQFAYSPNWSTDDAINHILHYALSHLDQRKWNLMLFVENSSAFNSDVPLHLCKKL